MPKFNDFKKIVDDCLQNLQMTESQKQDVLRNTRKTEQKSKKSYKRYYAYGTSVVAACLALALIITQLLPTLNNSLHNGSFSDSSSSTGSVGSNIGTLLMDASSINIKATDEFASGIKTDTSFLITTNQDNMTSDILAEKLSISPNVGFTVHDEGNGEFLLETESAFDNNSIVNISFTSDDEQVKTWAFQTESKLTVRSTLPGNNTVGMPLDTGIEIYFSRSVDNIDGYFEISPKIDGKFLYENNTVIFVPNKELESDNMIYTVTIKAGLKDVLGAELEEDYAFSFRTSGEYYGSDKPRFHSADNFTETYLSDDMVSLSIYSNEQLADKDIKVKLYKLNSAEQYLSIAEEHDKNINPYIGYSNDYEIDTSKLALYSEFLTRLKSSDYYAWYTSYLLFPETPEHGWYLADIRVSDDESLFIQKLIQISDLSVYASTLNGDGIVWVNDARSGNAVANAKVLIKCEDTQTATSSNSDGLAEITVPRCDESSIAYVVVAADGHNTFVDSLRVSGEADELYSDSFYSYVYTDREAYLPTDTISFWGKLIPKYSGIPLPSSLDIYLDNSETPTASVTVSADGSFEGSIDIENHISQGSFLHFKSNGQSVYSRYYSVIEYNKPSYVLNMSADKEFYRKGESPVITVNGSFYSGEPAVGLDISVFANSFETPLVLDENGEVKYVYSPQSRNASWFAFSRYINASTSGAENVWTYSYLYVPCFDSDYMLNYEKLNESGTKLKINVNEIDFSKVNERTLQYDKEKFANAVKGDTADASGRIEIIRCEYIQKQEGTKYNFITKRNEPVYSYEYVESPYITHEFTTQNGIYTTPDFKLDYSNSCWYIGYIYYTTPDGVQLKESINFGNNNYFPSYYGNPYTFVYCDNGQPRVGDEVELELRYKAQVVDSGKMLVNTSQNDFMSSDAIASGKYSFKFTDDHKSGVYVSGAYFDGKHIYNVAGIQISYDSSELALNINISTDKDDYSPGDTVEASIKVTDENGKPVKTDYVLSVVDDAAFAIMEQYSDPLTSLYNSTYYAHPETYTSFIPRFEDNIYAEGGGDGASEGIRSDFKDNAAFISSSTDKNGKGTIEFTIPDNLTSWRITVAAVSDSGYAGISKKSITASIPYFVNVVHNDEYIKGDDIVISSKVYSSDETTEYTVTVKSGASSIVKTFSGESNKFVYMNLGKLDTGVYSLTVEADSGKLHDAVRYDFDVVESKHELPITETFDMEDGVNISSLRYPVKLLVYDKTNTAYMRALSRMLSNGSRFDQKAANAVAEAILYGDYNAELNSYQTYENGISMFTYGDADAVTTAKALIAVPDRINKDGAVEYLYSVIYNNDSAPTDVAAAYMGLASQKEPVLFDIQLLLRTDDFTLEEQLYLATALAIIGDHDNAKAWFNENISKINAVKASDDLYRLRSQSLLLSELIGSSKAMETLNYVCTNYSAKYLPSLDLAAYVRHTKLTKESDASFTCIINSEKRVVNFENSSFHVYTMSKSELETADFTVISGDIGITASYVAASDSIEDTSNDMINVATTCDLQSDTVASVGSLITVTHEITVDNSISNESMMLSVSLPSNQRFVYVIRSYGSGVNFCGEEDGRIYVYLTGGKSSYTLSYCTRTVFPGEFVFEPVIITSNESDMRYVGERKVISSK